MILVQAPLRISFVGGGTDMAKFYRRSPGRVISAAIDKYVFIVINRTPLIDAVSARYSQSETVRHPSMLQHTRIKAALLDLEIDSNVEIGSFASLPNRAGLGSSSSFSVALLAGLHAFKGQVPGPAELAEMACRLEIELVGERIGKQDQYAAAFGGLHVFQFNPDDSVDVRRVALTPALRRKLEYHMLVFFTGITRDASSVLCDQQIQMEHGDRFRAMEQMAADVDVFERHLMDGDLCALGQLLHSNWMRKRELSTMIANGEINELYQTGMQTGAWGGKLLGAGGGGCLMFLAPPERHDAITAALHQKAADLHLTDSRDVPVSLSSTGCEVVFRGGSDR